MKVKLVSNDMWSPVLEFSVQEFPCVIGRNGKSNIHVDDRWMSSRHCELSDVEGELVVRDLRSRHGTLVNGQCASRMLLEPGDTLTVGVRSFRVSYRRSAPRGNISTDGPIHAPSDKGELERTTAN